MNGPLLGAVIGLFLFIQALLGWKPSLFTGVYLYLPLLGAASLALHLAAKAVSARPQTERHIWLSSIGAACVMGVVFGLIGGGNDGSATTVLPLVDVAKSIVSGGFLPWKQGMVNILRFLPLTAALAVAWFAIKRGVPKTRTLVTTVLVYLGISLLWQLPSFMALVVRQVGTPIETTQDVYVILIRALTNTYWANDLGNRFLSPIAEQGKSGLILFHAAFITIITACTSLGMFLFRSKNKEEQIFQVKDIWIVGGLLSIGISGLILGQSVRVMPKVSTVSFLVDAVFLTYLISGALWLRTEDLRGEGEERAAASAAARSFFLGSAGLLGWPVFLGAIVGPLMAIFKKELYLENFLGEAWSKRLVFGVTSLGLGWGALLVGLQDITPLAWMIRLMLGFALSISLASEQKTNNSTSPVLTSVCIGLSALLSGQSLIGLAALPAVISVWIIESRENSHKWRFLPLLLFTVWYSFCLLFFPSHFSRV